MAEAENDSSGRILKGRSHHQAIPQNVEEAENDSSGRILKAAPARRWQMWSPEAENDSSGRILKEVVSACIAKSASRS